MPDDLGQKGCRWRPCLDIDIRPEWPSGCYLLRLTNESGKQAEAFFVVRSTEPKDALFVLATSTWAAYNAWGEKLEAEGRMQLGHKLTDGEGCVLDPQADGSVTTKDGPYTETKEVVGGIYVIDADDYAHAARLCEGHPNFRFGSIEIRQLDFLGGPEE